MRTVPLPPTPPPADPRRVAADAGPSHLRRAFNYAKAIGQHAAAGFRTVPLEVAAARLAKCPGCEFHAAARGVCLHADCGCPLEKKVRWATQRCPKTPPAWDVWAPETDQGGDRAP